MAMTFAHAITLDNADFVTLKGIRAAWGKTLIKYGVTAGHNGLSEKEAWDFYRVVEEDTNGLATALPGITRENVSLSEKVWCFLGHLV